ncbi:MAG: hypothetical protein LQ350_000187 [Teloschistes chrysophthalmus]|nr:MAG: hypothetical protein LQ350_000187 [Niorma chrysophthalma]
MASYQTGPVTDASGPTAADPVEILNANLQAMFNQFLSQQPSAEGLYAAHTMFGKLAAGTYERYCQQLRQDGQVGPQVGEETQWQINDELPQQPFDEFQRANHSSQHQSSIEVTYALDYSIFACVANPVQEPSAQSTPTSGPIEQPIVPDAVFIAESGRPYDPFWMENWHIAPGNFQSLRSKLKFTDIFDRGALQYDNDVLRFTSITSAGWEIERRFVIIKSQATYVPIVKLLRDDLQNPWDSDLTERCRGLGEILQFVKRCTGDNPRYKTCLNYRHVSVSRNGAEIGTLAEIRHRFHMWEHNKDLFTARSGLPGRKRRINKKTGQFSDFPGLERAGKKWKPARTGGDSG